MQQGQLLAAPRRPRRRLSVEAVLQDGCDRAVAAGTDLDAAGIVEAAMIIAAELCIFTNHHLSMEVVTRDNPTVESSEQDKDASND